MLHRTPFRDYRSTPPVGFHLDLTLVFALVSSLTLTYGLTILWRQTYFGTHAWLPRRVTVERRLCGRLLTAFKFKPHARVVCGAHHGHITNRSHLVS